MHICVLRMSKSGKFVAAAVLIVGATVHFNYV
jgi:6,7-dimethyl-8-ribityllumazine synthase